MTKTCSKCKTEKNINDFGKYSKSKDGFRGCCKECRRLETSTEQQKKMARIRRKKYAASEHGIKKRKDYAQTEHNKKLHRARCRKYEQTEHFKAKRYEYEKNRYQNNQNYRLISNLRCRLYGALNRSKGSTNVKTSTTIDLLGCTVNELWDHLESLFIEGMTRENYGEWHVDHIKPCASFDLSNPKEQQKCFHYTNLQPLWALDNLSKGDREI